MHRILLTLFVGFAAFVGTMTDNFAALVGQLALTDRSRHRRLAISHGLAIAVLIIASSLIGGVLISLPVQLVGVLALAPFALAVVAWRNRNKVDAQFKRGATTTFLVAVALGGDNLAVWIPLLRAAGTGREVVLAVTLLASEGLLLLLALQIVRINFLASRLSGLTRHLTPVLYVLLGFLVLWQCHLL
ncbi:MAG: hypothetical protein WCG86_03990 [Actinomycetota bacterium]